MFKDTKCMGNNCGYKSDLCNRAYRWGLFLVFALLAACVVDAFIQAAPQHAFIAVIITAVLVLMIKKIMVKKRMMRRMLELKIAKFVPDVCVTPDDKSKSLIIYVSASKYASAVLKQVWECEDASPEAPDSENYGSGGELVKMKLPCSIRKGTELMLKVPMPSIKSKKGEQDICAKIGLKIYVPMLSRKLIVKICPYSCCMSYHIVHCWWSQRQYSCK